MADPGGGSPDMGGVSADGRVLWLSGRYNAEVYAIYTTDGQAAREDPGRAPDRTGSASGRSRAATRWPHRHHPLTMPGFWPAGPGRRVRRAGWTLAGLALLLTGLAGTAPVPGAGACHRPAGKYHGQRHRAAPRTCRER